MILGVSDMVGSAGEEKDGTGSARAVPGAVIPQRTKRNGRRLLSPAGAMRQKCSRVRTVADSPFSGCETEAGHSWQESIRARG